MDDLDPRLTPARPDLAAKHLEGTVQAQRYVDGVLREVIEAQTAVRLSPRPDAPLATEALMGERITVYETTEEGWCWGQLQSDRYVGWLSANALTSPSAEPSHKVGTLRSLIFPGPSIKLAPSISPPFGARLAITRFEPPFAITAAGGYMPAAHLVPMTDMERDPVAVAERFIGTPYLWGGKTSLGLDCSGLVQIALTGCGIPCPRDTDMQEGAVGGAVSVQSDLADLRRGDLIFWKGHVALVCDSKTLVHANAFHMSVVSEPIAEAVSRIGAAGSAVTSVKRVVGNA
jgi:cell wall-associated NlpC family hydrolase